MTSASTLWTIGHSTKPAEELLTLLRAQGIRRLIDIRTIPRSRYNPQYNRETLERTLSEAGLLYDHLPSLGGRRKPRKDSPNVGWRNESFRGYADYMQTEEFTSALETLMAYGRITKSAIMCAEAVPWRCHRSLVADALLIRGWTVKHILSQSKCNEHHLTPFAVVDQGRLSYPPPADSTISSKLF